MPYLAIASTTLATGTVHALDDLLLRSGCQAGHGVVFIQQRDVAVHVVLLLHHAFEAGVQDDAYFVGPCVRFAVRRTSATAARQSTAQNMMEK